MSSTPMPPPAVTSQRGLAGTAQLILLLMLFAAFGHFNRVGISVAGTEVFIPKYGLSETRMGWVYTTFLIVYTLGMLPAGWLIDLIGSSRALTLYGVLMGLFVVATGILGWLTSAPETLWIGLLVIRGIAGLCNAPLHPGAAHVVSHYVAEPRRAAANGLVTAGALVGIALSYPLFGALMDRLGWPFAFIVSGIALCLYGLLWNRLTRDLAAAHRNETEVHDSGRGIDWRLLVDRNLWLLSISYAGYGYFQYLFFYWMDYYFKTVLKVASVDARWASFGIMLAMGAGMAVGGLLTDLVGHLWGASRGRRAIVVVGMGLGAVFGLIGVNLTSLMPVAICLALSMAALGMCEGVFWTTATDLGGRSRGFAGAFMNTWGNLGGLISPVLTPAMAQALGWSGSFAVACAIAAAGGAVWFLIRLAPAAGSTAWPQEVPRA